MWYCAIGPRYCSDGVSNEICLYYKFNVYHSLAFIDKSKSLDYYGITLKRQITDIYIKERYYFATDKHGDEIIVVEYNDHLEAYKNYGIRYEIWKRNSDLIFRLKLLCAFFIFVGYILVFFILPLLLITALPIIAFINIAVIAVGILLEILCLTEKTVFRVISDICFFAGFAFFVLIICYIFV